MNIYDIDARLLELVDPETGELLDEDAFLELQMERGEKIEGMILWYKDLAAEAAAVKAEADTLSNRARVTANRAERLREYIAHILGGEKFKTARCSVSYRESSAVEVSDEAAFAAWAVENGHTDCLVYKAPAVNKTAVKALLKDGGEIPMARIIKKRNIQVK